jgi:hypothetical protein
MSSGVGGLARASAGAAARSSDANKSDARKRTTTRVRE